MAIFSVLTAFWIIKTSQAKKRSKEEKQAKWRKQRTAAVVFFRTFGALPEVYFIFYIPFQSSGSQESNASNRVRFGAEMRKIWPSEDNCSRLVRNSHNTFRLCEGCVKLAQHSHNTCTTPSGCAKLVRNSHNPCMVRNFLCFCRLHFRFFLM